MHGQCAQKRFFAIFDKAWVHRPLGIFGVRRDVHDDLAETATNARFRHGIAKAVEAIAVSELDQC